MPGIFVSYRRDDSQGFAGRLADDLIELFGPDRVFRDIEIPVGSDFSDVLHRAIAASDLLLVVIGRQWAAQSDSGYGSRLFEPTDWVRTEIEAAFAQGKQVVPVLVGGAEMPAAGSLPPSIAGLVRLQAAALSDRHWDDGLEDLADRLRVLCPTLGQDVAAAESPAEVLREIGDRFLEEVASRRRPRVQPPRLPPTFGQQMAAWFARGLKKTLGVVVGLTLIYAGIRLFGDEQLLGMLDDVEARLLIGWERLNGYIARL